VFPAVELAFERQQLASLCNSERALVRKFGPEAAKRIRRRLTQLAAATCLQDLRNAPGRCHELAADRAGHLNIDLHGPYRLIFAPTEHPPPAKSDGGLDWSAVIAVTISEITDTHENQ
jgi:plasmid maintenance system killer protein